MIKKEFTIIGISILIYIIAFLITRLFNYFIPSYPATAWELVCAILLVDYVRRNIK